MTFRVLVRVMLSHILMVVLIPFAAVAASAFVNYRVLPLSYTAETTLYVLNKQTEDAVSYNDLVSSGLLIADYKEMALSKRVTQAAADSLGLESLDGFDVEIEAASNTRIIKIRVTSTDPRQAAAASNALSEAFSLCVMDIMQVENISIVDAAQVPLTPSGPLRTRNILIAGILGLALSVGLSVLIAYSDTAIREAEDVEKQLSLPLLAQIPRISSHGKADPGTAIDAYYAADIALRDAVKALRTNIHFAGISRNIRTVTVTSSVPEEGKTTLALFLAMAMAEAGRKTLLVEADFRKPMLGNKLRQRTRSGLLEYLSGKVRLSAAAAPTPMKGLFFVDVEPGVINPVEIFGSSAFKHAVLEMRKEYDIIIFDTPPLASFIDASVVGSVTDAVLLVIKAGRTDVRTVRRVLGQLKKANAWMMGAVLNAVRDGRNRYYYKKYYKGYRSGDSSGLSGRTPALPDWRDDDNDDGSAQPHPERP